VIIVEDCCSVLVIPGRDSTMTGRDATVPDTSNVAPKKYRLTSDLSQTVNVAQIGEKILDTSVQLSVHEVLAVSSDVFSYLQDQTRQCSSMRIPFSKSKVVTITDDSDPRFP